MSWPVGLDTLINCLSLIPMYAVYIMYTVIIVWGVRLLYFEYSAVHAYTPLGVKYKHQNGIRKR